MTLQGRDVVKEADNFRRKGEVKVAVGSILELAVSPAAGGLVGMNGRLACGR